MTADNSVLDSLSAKSAALEMVATENLTCDSEAEVANCSDLGEDAVSSESAIIENVAKLAKLYAAGTPWLLRHLGAKSSPVAGKRI